MINKYKILFSSQVARYLCSGVIARAISFLSVIIFSYLLSTEEFGESVVFLSIVSVCSTFINFSVNQMIVREKVFLSFDDFSVLMSSSLLLSIILTGFLVIIFFILSFFNFDFKIDRNYLLLGLVFSFFLSAIDLSSKIFVTCKNPIDYGLNEISKVAIGLFIGLLLIFLWEQEGLFSRIAGYVLGLAFSLFFSFILLKKYMIFTRPVFARVVNIFFHGCKVFPQLVSNWVKLGADKIILSVFLSLSDIGIYSFSFAICSIAMLLGVALNNAFTPVSMDFYQSGQLCRLKRLRKKYTVIMLVFSVFFTLLVCLLKQYFWPESYEVSEFVIVLFGFSFFSQAVYLFYAKFFLFKLKLVLLSFVNLIVSIGYVVMLLLISDSMSVILAAALLGLYSLCIMCWVFLYTVFGERAMSKESSGVFSS